ncbi:SEC-C motif [Kingella potus]|uniref:SEC-C motif n=1 Tax=Kingella potus TaxID=265175 RepID=A0A377QZR9_9NEIS|nr:YchJ family protein [Kingella potus]UOP01832.1 YchJ family protein [Kingella potus]STR00924.1 SEC-C motif [Kingella potus]
MENQACPCQSALSYAECCRPLHAGAPAADALALMRSRYAAYVLQLAGYIVQTTVPAQQGLLDTAAIAAWSRETRWLGLEIRGFRNVGTRHAQVEFAAFYAGADGTRQAHHELSAFVRTGGCWYFIDPTVSLPAAQSPCFCGSGRKFKVCCGRFFRA